MMTITEQIIEVFNECDCLLFVNHAEPSEFGITSSQYHDVASKIIDVVKHHYEKEAKQ